MKLQSFAEHGRYCHNVVRSPTLSGKEMAEKMGVHVNKITKVAERLGISPVIKQTAANYRKSNTYYCIMDAKKIMDSMVGTC